MGPDALRTAGMVRVLRDLGHRVSDKGTLHEVAGEGGAGQAAIVAQERDQAAVRVVEGGHWRSGTVCWRYATFWRNRQRFANYPLARPDSIVAGKLARAGATRLEIMCSTPSRRRCRPRH
jgi:hypothetical protein